ncbi:MAG: hypothetical protein EAZ70_02045 [Runella slithyformis]|nr:MAG: hypothetical protein EAZ70_02045 [Runella slithyformis]TAF48238.1 MAG: hypothetical protein EAZ63_06115 [Runella slithyformis]
MIKRIKEISDESAWVLAEIIGYSFEAEMALKQLEAALADLEASFEPDNAQVEIVFTALAELKIAFSKCLEKTPTQYQNLIENLTDRIDIFLFHHRLF